MKGEKIRTLMATDRELIEKVRHGERRVYGQLFQKYYDQIHAICLAMLKNPHDSEELAQDVFVLAYLLSDSTSLTLVSVKM